LIYKQDTLKLLIPIMYEWALGKSYHILSLFFVLHVTFDAWTSLAGQKYLAITYHGIRRDTFELVSMVLDLVPTTSQLFGTHVNFYK
jgi:hypothetical protein